MRCVYGWFGGRSDAATARLRLVLLLSTGTGHLCCDPCCCEPDIAAAFTAFTAAAVCGEGVAAVWVWLHGAHNYYAHFNMVTPDDLCTLAEENAIL